MQTLIIFYSEALWVKYHRVASHIEATGTTLDGKFLHQHLAGLETYVVDDDCVHTGTRQVLRRRRFVTEVLGVERDAPHAVTLQYETPKCVGHKHPNGGAFARGHHGLHLCPVQGFARLGINDASLHNVGLQRRCQRN